MEHRGTPKEKTGTGGRSTPDLDTLEDFLLFVHFATDRRGAVALVHPWTLTELLRWSEHHRPLWRVGAEDWKLSGFPVEEDARIPPGIVRLKSEKGEESADVPLFPMVRKLGELGGICEASAHCPTCGWTMPPLAEGTYAFDAFKAAAFFAREHRAESGGHQVEVEARINYVGYGRDGGENHD